MIGILIFVIALGATIYGSYTDIKIREVPNWISYPLIISMLLLRLIHFAITRDLTTLIYSAVTGGAFLVVGLLMFYAGQWGGADWKVLTALGFGFGSLIGFTPMFSSPWPFGITLMMNFLAIAAVVSIIYAFYISFGNKKVYADTKKNMRKYEFQAILILFFAGCIATLYNPMFSLFAVMAPLWLLIKYIKSVEKLCLIRERAWKDVVEFDIPVKDLKYRGKILQKTEDPNGFTLEILKKCQDLAKKGKLPKKIIVKWGMPLVPVFPITILVSVFLGDLLYVIINTVV